MLQSTSGSLKHQGCRRPNVKGTRGLLRSTQLVLPDCKFKTPGRIVLPQDVSSGNIYSMEIPQSRPHACVAILGGTGFIGRHLVEGWPESSTQSPHRLLIHRSRPAWLPKQGFELREIDLTDPHNVVRALDQCDTLINLVRPDGDGTVLSALKGLVRALADSEIKRIVHAGSVEVYGSAEAPFVTESTPPQPQTPYQLEHSALETMWLSGSIPATLLRLGAVFGPSGRNLLSIASDMKHGRAVKLAAQRALNGHRRLHLVAVTTVVDAVRRIVFAPTSDSHSILLVTADNAEQNNFSFVCDRFARAFGTHVPKGFIAPRALLRVALKVRGQSPAAATRRYSGAQLSALGIHPERTFAADIDAYASHLAAQTPASP